MIIEQPPVNYTRATPLVERRGLIIVNTGDGKGKSTAAFGLALRAHGRGKAVKIYQFMKPLQIQILNQFFSLSL